MRAESPSSVTDFRLSSGEKTRSWQGEGLRTVAGMRQDSPTIPQTPDSFNRRVDTSNQDTYNSATRRRK